MSTIILTLLVVITPFVVYYSIELIMQGKDSPKKPLPPDTSKWKRGDICRESKPVDFFYILVAVHENQAVVFYISDQEEFLIRCGRKEVPGINPPSCVIKDVNSLKNMSLQRREEEARKQEIIAEFKRQQEVNEIIEEELNKLTQEDYGHNTR